MQYPVNLWPGKEREGYTDGAEEGEVMDNNATLFQKKKIAQLCQARGIKSPVEEQPMTRGNAGRLIRELSKGVSK